LKSVETHLGHSDYSRLKLGVGRPPDGVSVIDYVLEPFSQEEQDPVNQVLDFAAKAAVSWLEGDTVEQLSQSVNGWSAPESSVSDETESGGGK
jgi:PTH1 family peptidyl-tRNA hydrolase